MAGKPVDYVRQRMEEDWYDESGDLLVGDMDNAGIDTSVFFILDLSVYAGVDDRTSLLDRFRIAHEAVQKHPTRLMFFGGVDPRRPDALELIDRSVQTGSLRGVKIWPPAGIAPDAPDCYRLYAKCEAERLPVVIHTGHELGPFKSAPARPILCDRVAADFPDMTIVMAHAGMGWWEEAASIASAHPNVYMDIAYWQQKYLKSPALFGEQLRRTMDIAGSDRMLFGSDWPAMRKVKRVAPDKWVSILQQLAREPLEGWAFSEEEIRALLGGNATRLFKLDSIST
jgi:predicted TIM-barrel fold metal-dependent hydrolase